MNISSPLHFIARHPIGMILTGFLGGTLLPDLASLLNPFILPILMGVVFLSFLKLDLAPLWAELKDWRRQAFLFLISMAIIPLAVFLAAKASIHLFALDPAHLPAALLLFSCPTSSLATTLSLLFDGRFERTVANMLFTLSLAPLTLPLTMSLLLGETVGLSYAHMTQTLLLLLFIPAIAALAAKRFRSNGVSFLTRFSYPISLILLVFVVIGALKGFLQVALDHPANVFKTLIFSSFLMVMTFSLGYALGRGNPRDRMTLAIISAWPNLGLSIGLAHTFFKDSWPYATICLAVMVIPWYLTIFMAKFTSEKITERERVAGVEG
ncbi:MAG: bile acid:sodium symporter [Bacteriovoracales bacterium]|nr:bile acid:sodium symporter [Bacteriovoracales bacterium]